MQGFQPAARRLAQHPQQPQHLADGGAVAFGARGLAGLRQMVPLVQAMGYPQQAAAPAPSPAPAADPRAAQLQAMIPRMEAMGYRQAGAGQPQFFARGGMVRGPGTGTSDSIETEAEPGTFIMPADSTAEIGPSALEKMGTVPVRLSDGEFQLPPEQVMAIGEAVLKLMKDATHAPVNGQDGGQTDEEVAEARGFSPMAAQRMQEVPEQYFADGGAVGFPMQRLDIGQWAQQQEQGRGDLARQEARQAQAREDQAAADAEAVAQSEAFKRRQAEGASAATGYADGGLVDPARRPNSFGDAAAVASDPSTTQVRTSAADTFGRPPAAAPAAAPAPALGSNLAAVTRMGSYTDPRSTMYDPNPYAASNAAKMAASGQSSRATVEAGMPPAPAPVTAGNSFGDATAATRDANVTQVAGFQPGRGTVSTVPAQPVAPRAPAAPALAAAPAAPAAGFQTAAQRMAAAPAAAPAQPQAPLGWQARQDQRNLEVTAASIMDSPERRTAQQRLGMVPAAAGFQPRRFADGGTVEDDLQKRLAQIPAGGPAGWTGGGTGGSAGSGGGAGGVTGTWSAPEAAPAARPPAGALSRAAGYIAPSPAPAEQALSAMPAANPAPSQPISVQNQDAAQGLARRGAADAMAALPAAAPQTNVQAPLVRHSGNDWQARKDLENARTSALSITNRPEWSNSGMSRFRGGQGGPSPDVAAYNAMLANDLALRGAQPGMDQAAMRETGENQRTGMQVTANSANAAADRMGALDRTLITERGNNTRAGLTAAATTEAARLKAQQDGKAPPGYRFTANGNMEAIPGGPADLKQNKEGVQQGKDTQDIFSIINEARPLLLNATGSFAGVAADKLGQAVGYATDGAKATAQLKALEGALVSKMPKMSGPQSDKDVLLYKQMAGQIGDATIPIEQRQAAMNTIENLNMKYLPAAADQNAYQALPSGSYYRAPNGEVRRKQ